MEIIFAIKIFLPYVLCLKHLIHLIIHIKVYHTYNKNGIEKEQKNEKNANIFTRISIDEQNLK